MEQKLIEPMPEEAPSDALRPLPRQGPIGLWTSRISWRITLTVFATILLVQTCVLIFTARNLEKDLLANLREQARIAVATLMEKNRNQRVSPLLPESSERLFEHTAIRGIAIYNLESAALAVYGDRTVLTPHGALSSRRSVDGRYYDVLYIPAELSRPYYVAASLNATGIEPTVQSYVRQNLLIFLLMSGFVTSVLMLALGQWLLQPIMILRSNLLSAAEHPERPLLRRLPHEIRDEIGIAVQIANNLMRQNANNLKRLKTQAEDKIHRLAYYDALTGLPNRTFFMEKLEERIKSRVIASDGRLVILSVDIDHFKDVNDSMGHDMGDKLLETVGRRLVSALPEGTLIARASADEFIIMAHLNDTDLDSQSLVEQIFTAMSEPISIVHERFQVRVSIGVARCPEDGTEARQVLKNADIALNRAKEEGRDTVRYYSQDFDRAVQARFQMLRDLRVALDEGQLRLHYQPQFDLRTGALIGAEALLRWWKPDNSKAGGSFISPVEFIPVAEQSGLIVPLGEWVLRAACIANRQWQDQGLPPIRVAVNISGVQFHRADIVQLVQGILNETRLHPRHLELEITEGVFMQNTQAAIDVLDRLHALGCEIAVDDFGTGYSSLSYLRRFPIDRIKVDQSFIRNALNNPDDAIITKTIINLGHSLGLKVIAEGVESSDHEEFLKREGCDEAQGFKYARPMPPEDFISFVRAHLDSMRTAPPLTKNTKGEAS